MRFVVALLVASACGTDDPTECFEHPIGIPQGIVGFIGTSYNAMCRCYPPRQYARVDATNVMTGEGPVMVVADADGYYELAIEPATYRVCAEGTCRNIDVASGVARWDFGPFPPFNAAGWKEIVCVD